MQRGGRLPAQREFFSQMEIIYAQSDALAPPIAIHRLASSIALPTRISVGHSVLFSITRHIHRIQAHMFDDAGSMRNDGSGIGNLRRWRESLNKCKELLIRDELYGPLEQELIEHMLTARTMRNLWEIVEQVTPDQYNALETSLATYNPQTVTA